MLVILFFFNFLFLYYFFMIGQWYLGIFPIGFLIFFLFNFTDGKTSANIDIKSFAIKNLYFFAWIIVMVGLIGVLSYFIKSFIVNIFFIFYLNIFLVIVSYIFDYNDGKKIFHFGLYFSIGLFFSYFIYSMSFTIISLKIFLEIIGIFVILLMGIYSFLYFVVGIFKNTQELKYLHFLFANLSFFISIYLSIYKSLYLSVLFCQIYLLLFYVGVYTIIKYFRKAVDIQKEQQQSLDKDKLSEMLQKDMKIIPTKKDNTGKYIFKLYNYVVNIPDYVKFSFSLSNVILVFIQIYLFWSHIGTQQLFLYEFIYRIAVLVFFANFILLKIINFYYYLQRFFVFFILNFAIYLSILNFFGNDIIFIVIVGVIWNILNSLVIFFSEKTIIRKFLYKDEYYLWMVANFFASLVNMFFIFKLPIDIKMRFSIVFLYIGIYIFLSINNFKYIEKKL